MWIDICKYVFCGICLIDALVGSLVYFHMLQLSGYHHSEYSQWCKEHPAAVFPLSRILLIVLSLLVLILGQVSSAINEKASLILLIVMIAIAIISFFANAPKKAKKPLVYTKRVQRLLVTFAILVALWIIIERYTFGMFEPCGIAFLLLIVPALVTVANWINGPIEKSIANGYVKDAEKMLSERPDLIIVGITGSYGKTSTKNFLHALLSTQYNTLMTPASFNTTMGVVRAIRENLKPSHEVFICEMGAKGVGEIKEICDFVHPKYGMITSIGEQHLETFLSVDNIIKTKFELADALPSDGFISLNMDNEYIANHEVSNTRVVSYGLTANGYHAENMEVTQTGSHFELVEPNGKRTLFTTKLLGTHNIQNILGCLSVAIELGIPAEKLVYAVRLLKPVEHRMELLPNGYIDDAFNSNPAGFRAALDVLSQMSGQRVLVTPGMVELGERQAPLNKELGAYAAKCCDYAVLVGEKQAPPLKEGLLEAGYDESRIYVAKSLNDALRYVSTLPNEGKRTVLLENDLPDNYN